MFAGTLGNIGNIGRHVRREVLPLWYDFTAGLTLTAAAIDGPAITFTRASNGTYFDSAGVLQTAGNNVARFDHDPATGVALGLLIEAQRTNLFLRSEEFDNASWTKTRASVTADQIAAPDGNTTADKLIEDATAANDHKVWQTHSVISGTAYTLTCFAKANTRTEVRLTFSTNFPANTNAHFDLSDGTVLSTGAGATASSIQDVGNGWYRCRVTATANATGSNTQVLVLVGFGGSGSYNGDGVSSIYIWGAQVEAGAFVSSYIKTTTASATRAIDVASLSTTGWFNADAGTLFVLANDPIGAVTVSRALWQLSDQSISNQIWDTVAGPSIQDFSIYNGTFQAAITGVAPAIGETKHAAAWQTNDAVFYTDGVNRGSDVSVTLPTGIVELRLGTRWNDSGPFSGHIAEIRYYNVRKPNSFLDAITT